MANSLDDLNIAFLNRPVLDDYFITGGAARSALNDNLLAASGSAAIDTIGLGNSLGSVHSFNVQVNAGAGISAGAITFEGSNDNANWTPMPWVDGAATSAAVFSGAAITIAASTFRFFQGPITFRYFRARISTAFVGGTVSATARFSTVPYTSGATTVKNNNATTLLMTNTPTTPSASAVTSAATTNATNTKNAAGALFAAVLSNPTATAAYFKLYNKASAPTVGTDVPVDTIPVPANSCTPIALGALGMQFTTGISWALTGAIGDTDTSAAVAGVHVHLSYL